MGACTAQQSTAERKKIQGGVSRQRIRIKRAPPPGEKGEREREDGGRTHLHVDSRELGDPGSAHWHLLDQVSVAELVRRHVIHVRNGQEVESFADELDLIPLDVPNDEDLGLGEVVEGQVRHGVSEDGLLNEKDVAPALSDLFHDAQNVVPLLLENPVHLLVVVDDDSGLEVGLGGRDAELNESDLGVLDPSWSSAGGAWLLVQEHAIVEHDGVVDRSSALLDDGDVPEVDPVRVLGVDDLENGVDRHGSEKGGVLGHDLAAEGRGCGSDERLPVLDGNGGRHLLQDLRGLLARLPHGVRDDRGVNALVEELEALLEERPANHDNGGGPVAGVHVLRLGELDEHLRRGVDDLSSRAGKRGGGRQRFGEDVGGAGSPLRARSGKNRGRTLTLSRIVAPSLVMMTSPSACLTILSIPLGPRDVLTASESAFAASMFEILTSTFLESSLFSFSGETGEEVSGAVSRRDRRRSAGTRGSPSLAGHGGARGRRDRRATARKHRDLTRSFPRPPSVSAPSRMRLRSRDSPEGLALRGLRLSCDHGAFPSLSLSLSRRVGFASSLRDPGRSPDSPRR